MQQLIPKQTAAFTASHYFQINHIGCSVVVSGDLGANEIPVFFINGVGDETPAYDSDGNALVLSATNPFIPIHAACNLRFKKGATGLIGVDIHGLG